MMTPPTATPSEIGSTKLCSEDDPCARYDVSRERAIDNLPDDADAQLVVGTVLRVLYYQHPVLRLEDILELNHLIIVNDLNPSESVGLDDRVQSVLDRALTHLAEWKIPNASDGGSALNP